MTNCQLKTQYLPQITHPYVAELGFYEEIENLDGKLKRKKFKDGNIRTPFYFLVKIKDVENSGKMGVFFYEIYQNQQAKQHDQHQKKIGEKIFTFGEEGKYYEYIMFFDRVDKIQPGKYLVVIFHNKKLIYQSQFTIVKEKP